MSATEGMKPGTLNKALSDLVADGQLRRIQNGVYEVPAAAKATSAPAASEQGTLL